MKEPRKLRRAKSNCQITLLVATSGETPLRDSSEDGPKQDSHLGVGDEVHGAVVVLLDEVANQTAIFLNSGVLSRLGSSGGSSRRSRPKRDQR